MLSVASSSGISELDHSAPQHLSNAVLEKGGRCAGKPSKSLEWMCSSLRRFQGIGKIDARNGNRYERTTAVFFPVVRFSR